ncbi:oxygen-independent coproporphyrinogen III oxidase [Paracoccus sp. KR1-242]|uniref:oxygen-independent coproporphyrinogen III oxidase n=1 Tax=Paracoccus sp. KR1-242 TaxID=3410028 RepID=UPI003C104B3C
MEQQSQLERMGLFDARVPRYTSYPTAVQFSPKVDESRYREWLAEIPEGASISLYLHVPFCRRLCWFCACRTQGTQSEDPVRAYAEDLLAELALLRDALPRGIRLSRLHWGGGTPTLMPADTMRRVADAVLTAFPLDQGAEFSVEIDPNEIDESRMQALAQAGLTRASIGVQDFDPQIQKVIGRDQSFAVTRRAIDMIRATGIDSVNADILFGLPHQDQTRIANTVHRLLELSPDRIALYGYAHVPWMAKRQVMIPTESLPDPHERLHLFEVAREILLSQGYDEIGIDHFARPGDGLARAQRAGHLRRNFQGYTDDGGEILIGMGASAISRLPQGYAQNAPATPTYVSAIRDGRFSISRGHKFSAEDKWRARMIEALMCDFAISSEEFATGHGLGPGTLAALFGEVSHRFGDLVSTDEDGLRILPEGRPLTRMVAQMFDAYAMSPAGHSTAI